MSTSHEESSIAGPPQGEAPGPSAAEYSGPVAQTVHGPVLGSTEGRVNSWKGIRYAAAPVGELRWRAPQPPEPWTEIVDAQHFGAAAPQGANGIITIAPGVPFDEDCLSLNVWAAGRIAPGDRVPVMVWVHGGAYALGSSSQPLYDGGVLAADGDVIVVTLNYRLGALGFLDLTSLNGGEGANFDSNLALRDVLLALEWVRDSIAGFGGDPDQVTLFGESAGGGIVTTLLAVPAAAGLFHRAIAQSSPSTSVYRSSQATAVTEMFLDELGAGRNPAELRAASVDDIVAAGITVYQKVPLQLPGRLAYSPLVDGELVPDYPLDVIRAGKAHPVPLLIGTNKDEAALFRRMKSPLLPITKDTIDTMFADMAEERPDRVLPDRATVLAAYAKLPKSAKGVGIARDIAFRMPTLWLVEGHSAVAPVWLYRFDYSTPMLRLAQIGASHATELPYLWGHLSSGPKDPTFRLGGMGAALKISARMRERWTAFAVSGDPQAPRADAPLWPAYHPDDARSTLVIDRHDAVINDLDGALRTAWGDDVLSFP